MLTPDQTTAPIKALRPSPLQARRAAAPAADDDLRASIKAQGILQPLLVTSSGEIVCGHRRWRAAQALKLKEVPIRVATTDAQEFVRAAMLVENSQREPLDPIDEAVAIETLLAAGRPAAEIAAELGRSESYVLRRSRLAALPEAARDALAEGRLSLGGAELLARLPVEHHEKALAKIAPDWRDTPLSAEDVRIVIRDSFTLGLQNAPFDLADPELTEAGPCTSCPKRTGNQPALFNDEIDDICTDPDCFGAKKTAAWKAAKAAAKAKGLELLTPQAATKVLDHQGKLRPGYVKPTDKPEGSTETYRQLLGDAAPKAKVIPRAKGKDLQVYAVADLEKAVKKAGVKLPLPAPTEKPKPKGERDWKLEGEIRHRGDVLYLQAWKEALAPGVSDEVYRWAVKEEVDALQFELPEAMRDELMALAASSKRADLDLAHALVNLAAASGTHKPPPELAELERMAGIDRKAIASAAKKAVLAERAAAADAGAGGKKPAKKIRKGKKGAGK